ncbi:MAG: penicillin-binding protein, family, partial [Anaeromyxobacteraceae bacterium]|nr:penicillin-binding protein, family [Anaeromyxobacteraceae bacterium]
RVEAAMDLDEQRAAQQAMLRGLLEVDRRQGYWGPVARVEGGEREALRRRLAQAWPAGSLRPGDFAVGIVSAVNDASRLVRVEVGDEQGVLPIAGMRWARKPNSQIHWEYALIDRPSSALRAGDVVLVRRVERGELVALEKAARSGKPAEVPEAPLLLALEQEPRLQGALVSQDPGTGYVDAMVGGYDFEASEFNRAFQACRQPGSAFKPILYSAAIEKLGFTPSTLLTDAPVVFRDAERSWKPQNFGEDFKGEVPLRSAVISSMNIPAVKTAEMLSRKMGPGFLGKWAASLGITSPVKPELGSALGSSCATLLDLVDVYAVLDRQGVKRPSLLVRRVLDREGRLLEDRIAPTDPWAPLSERLAGGYAEVREEPVRVVEQRAAYVLQHLMQEVATVGTGAQAAKLGKPVAGKTGTTNDSFDTWFLGYTADQVAGVWLGFDNNEQPLGRPGSSSSASTRRPGRRWSPSSRACSSPTWRAPSRSHAPRERPAPPRSTCTTSSPSDAPTPSAPPASAAPSTARPRAGPPTASPGAGAPSRRRPSPRAAPRAGPGTGAARRPPGPRRRACLPGRRDRGRGPGRPARGPPPASARSGRRPPRRPPAWRGGWPGPARWKHRPSASSDRGAGRRTRTSWAPS